MWRDVEKLLRPGDECRQFIRHELVADEGVRHRHRDVLERTLPQSVPPLISAPFEDSRHVQPAVWCETHQDRLTKRDGRGVAARTDANHDVGAADDTDVNGATDDADGADPNSNSLDEAADNTADTDLNSHCSEEAADDADLNSNTWL